jgi:hypothetical protein
MRWRWLWIVLVLLVSSCADQVRETPSRALPAEPAQLSPQPTPVPEGATQSHDEAGLAAARSQPAATVTSRALDTPAGRDGTEPCPVTVPTLDHPTDTSIFGGVSGAEWFCSPDRELCAVKNGPWPAGGLKVGWRKPKGAQLEVTGRRLDAEAAPLRVSTPDGYWGTFQASGLTFPSEGCWEVEAQAEDSQLRFVVTVEPPPHRPAGGSCDDLAGAVNHADAIMVGWVTESDPHPSGYVWHTVRRVRVLKNPYSDSLLDHVNLLQDVRKEPLLETDQTYVLFMQRDPFQLFCPERTLAKVVGEYPHRRVVKVEQDIERPRLWSGERLTEVEAEINTLLRSPDATPASSAPQGTSGLGLAVEIPRTATPAPSRTARTPFPPESLSLPIASPPERAKASSTRLYVWSLGPSSVAVVDPASGHALREIPFKGHSPGVAVAPDGRTLYLVDGSGGGRLRVFDTTSWQVVHQEPVLNRALLKWGNPIALSGDGRWLAVERYSYERGQAWISVFDTRKLEFLPDSTPGLSRCGRSLKLVGQAGHDRLYTACGDAVVALDAKTLAPSWRVPVPTGDILELTLAPEGEHLYGMLPQVAVTTESGHLRVTATDLRLSVWNTTNGRLVQEIQLSEQVAVPTATIGRGDRGYLAVAPDDARLYLAWEDRLWALDSASLQVTGEMSLAAPVDGLALSVHGHELYLLPATAGDLRVRGSGLWTLDAVTLELTRKAEDWPWLSLPFMLVAPTPASGGVPPPPSRPESIPMVTPYLSAAEAGPCPVTPIRSDLWSGTAPVAGQFPVWISSGGREDHSQSGPIVLPPLSGGTQFKEGRASKALVFVDKRVQGDLTITGHQLDGDGAVYFPQDDEMTRLNESTLQLLEAPAAFYTIPNAGQTDFSPEPRGKSVHGMGPLYPNPGCYEFVLRIAGNTVTVVKEIVDR